MTEFFKFVFDLAFYYALTGYYTAMIFDVRPSVTGFLLLIAVTLADSVLRAKKPLRGRCTWLPLLLPVLVLFVRPGLWQILQMLPAWAYLWWSILTDHTQTDYCNFGGHYGFCLKLLLLMLLGIPFWEKIPRALESALPFLILMLAVGVCLLRMLRENRQEGLRQGIYVGVFILLCAGLTLGHVPQLLVQGIIMLYRSVLAPLLFGVIIFIAAFGYLLYLVLAWLISKRKGSSEQLQIQIEGVAEDLGLKEQYDTYLADLSWLKTLLLIAAAAVVIVLLFFILRRMLGDRPTEKAVRGFSERTERLTGNGGRKGKPGRIRPRDPRLAVRYYYGKFLAECKAHDLPITDRMTAREIAQLSTRHFPGAEPEELARIYAPARYSIREPVTAVDADAAAALWRKLKQAKREKINNN